MERKKLEEILDEVAEHWFVGIEQPTKTAKTKKKVASGKEKIGGYPQLLQLKTLPKSCPICKTVGTGAARINLQTRRIRYECGCEGIFTGFISKSNKYL